MRWGRRWRAWVALCDRREPALALALFRIAVGTVLAGTLLSVVFDGTVVALWVDAAHGGIFPSPRRTVLVDLLGGPTPPVVWGLVWTAVVGGIGTAIGAFGRLSPLIAVQAYAALYPTSINASSDWLIANGLWLLVLADATATLSLDAKLRHGRFVRDDVTVMAWPRYLAIFQLVCVYAFAGFEKIGEGWTFAEGYTAIYNVLQRPDRARFELDFLPSVYPVTQAMTFVSVYWEMSAPLLLLFYYYRATSESEQEGWPWPAPELCSSPRRAAVVPGLRRPLSPGHRGHAPRRALLVHRAVVLLLLSSPRRAARAVASCLAAIPERAPRGDRLERVRKHGTPKSGSQRLGKQALV